MSYPPIVPMIGVSDVKASMQWFESLGFTTTVEMNMPDGSIMHAELSKGDAVVMLGQNMGRPMGPTSLNLYMPVASGIDEYHDQVKAAGVTIAEGLTDQFWGDRTFMVTHPDGYDIMFAQPTREVSPEEMTAAIAEMAPVGASA